MSLAHVDSIFTTLEGERIEQPKSKSPMLFNTDTIIVQMKNWEDYIDRWVLQNPNFWTRWTIQTPVKTFKWVDTTYGRLRIINPQITLHIHEYEYNQRIKVFFTCLKK